MTNNLGVPRHRFNFIREADPTTIHYSLFTIHFPLPSQRDGYKNNPIA